jgi:hypothetical protein
MQVNMGFGIQQNIRQIQHNPPNPLYQGGILKPQYTKKVPFKDFGV